MPIAFRSVLDGPVSPIPESAVTWGGIIIGSMKRKPSTPLPRTSNSVSRTAKPPPRITAAIIPRKEVVSVLSVAFQSAGSASSCPASPRRAETAPVHASRASGSTLRTRMTMTTKGNSQRGWLFPDLAEDGICG